MWHAVGDGHSWCDSYPPPSPSGDWESWIFEAVDNLVPSQTVANIVKKHTKSGRNVRQLKQEQLSYLHAIVDDRGSSFSPPSSYTPYQPRPQPPLGPLLPE